MVVFLGGTCSNSKWRERLIPMLDSEYINPVVKTWTDDDYKRELKYREEADICLYVITPKLKGFYSIAEAVQDSCKSPEKTIVCILRTDDDKQFNPIQWRSMKKVLALCKESGACTTTSLGFVADYINDCNRRWHNRNGK